jgi:nitroreductase
MEFSEVVRRRKMVRSFEDRPVDLEVVRRLLDTARRAPSAGFSQGFDFVVLHGPEQTRRYWDITLPEPRRSSFGLPGLLRAPLLVLPITDKATYLARYSEPDKVAAGLQTEEAWPVRYWDVDTGMAAMLLLLAAVDEGLGALFFGIFQHEAELMAELGVPEGHHPIGTVAIGHPTTEQPPSSATRRPRRPLGEMVHFGHWSA